MKTLLLKLTNIGTNHLQGEDDKIRLSLLNSLSALAIFISIFFIALWLSIGEFHQTLLGLAAIFIFSTILILNSLGKISFSRYFYVLSTTFFIYLGNESTKGLLGMDKFYIATIAAPILFFPVNQKKNIIFCVLLTLTASIITPMIPLSLDFIPHLDSNNIDLAARFITPLSCLVALFTPIVLLLLLDKYIKEKVLAKEEESNALREVSLMQLASGVSHEINNPLAIILGRLNQLRRLQDKNSAYNKEFSAISLSMEDSVERIATIVESLSHFSKKSLSKKITLLTSKKLILDVLDLCSQKLAKSGISLEPQISSEKEITIVKTDFMKVLINIIYNAIEAFESSNTKNKRLIITSYDEKGGIVIAIEDNAKGMDKAAIKRAKDPFYRGEPFKKNMGLGLSVAHGIIKQHGGKMTIKSKEGEFTRVIIFLPPLESEERV